MSCQQLLDELKTYESEYREYRELFESDGSVDPTEQAQLDLIDRMIGQIRQSLGQQTSSNGNGMCAAPATGAAQATSATANASGMRVVPGAGGYEYEQHADGAIFIVKSPDNGSTRIEVQKGTTAYNAILAEIGPFPSDGTPGPSLPMPPGDSPNVGLPPIGGGGSGSPGYGDVQENPPTETPSGTVPASLERLMAKDELTTDEIAEARRLIAEQPQELQGALYEQLQEKAEYCNQRNNDCMEDADGGTCNLTAVAMALQYLGVKNPYPQMDYDEALVKIATENMGALTSSDTWKKVAAKLGVNNFTLFASSVKEKRAWWESTVDNGYLKKGYGIVMSLDGHVVRLQAVTDAGLVVDDPYGASKLSGRTFDDNDDGVADRPKYSFTDSNDQTSKDGDTAANAGDDTGYPWADVEKYTFKYLIALK
ncbi:MAG TPA: hypothetical protein VGK58_04390 [Lacipirellulaceae bacterium]